MIIREGCAIVGTEKIAMRRVVDAQDKRNINGVDESEIKVWQRNPKLLHKYHSQRIF